MDALKSEDNKNKDLLVTGDNKDNKSDIENSELKNSESEVQKQRLGVGNPETGIGSAAPLLGVMAIAGGLLKKE